MLCLTTHPQQIICNSLRVPATSVLPLGRIPWLSGGEGKWQPLEYLIPAKGDTRPWWAPWGLVPPSETAGEGCRFPICLHVLVLRSCAEAGPGGQCTAVGLGRCWL